MNHAINQTARLPSIVCTHTQMQGGVLQALIGLPDGPTVAYLRLHYFSSEGTRAVTDAISMAEYWGVEGYIIDLRNNPGSPAPSAAHVPYTVRLLLHAAPCLGPMVSCCSCEATAWVCLFPARLCVVQTWAAAADLDNMVDAPHTNFASTFWTTCFLAQVKQL